MSPVPWGLVGCGDQPIHDYTVMEGGSPTLALTQTGPPKLKDLEYGLGGGPSEELKGI